MGRALATLVCACALGVLAGELPDAIHLESLSPALAQAVLDAHGSAERAVDAAENAASRARAWGRLGMFLHAQHLPEAAEWAYGLALAEHNDRRWRHLRGVVLEEQGEIEAAALDYREAARLGRGEVATSVRLARSLLVAGDHAGARTALHPLDDDANGTAIVLATRAEIAMAQDRLEEAAGLLERAYELEPDAGAIAYKLAMVYRRLGNPDEARKWLRRRGDSNAAPVIDDSLLLDVARLSLSARFFVKVGEWALERGDTNVAVDSLARAAALAPGDVDIGLTHAHVLGVAERLADALREVRRVLEIEPESARGWYLLSWLLRSADDEAKRLEARQAARRSLGLVEDERTRALAAGLSMRDRRYAEAVADYEFLLSVGAGERAYYLYWLSLAMLGLGDCGAREPLVEALELRKGWGEAHLVMARAEAICGDAAMARRRVVALLGVRDDVDTRLTRAFVELASRNDSIAEELATADLPHPDAAMVLDALDRNDLPERVFARGSAWWVPSEVGPRSPSSNLP